MLRVEFKPEASLDALESSTTATELTEKLCGTKPDKPLFLFLVSQDTKIIKDVQFVQQGTMHDERVALGAKFFRLIQINGDEIGKEHPLAKMLGGKDLPRAVLISRDGETVKKLEGKISATRLFAAMTEIVKGDCKRDLGKFTSDMRKLLNDLEEVARDKQQLERKTAKALEKGGNVAAAKEVKKDQELLDKKREELAKRMEDLLAQTLPEKEDQAAKND